MQYLNVILFLLVIVGLSCRAQSDGNAQEKSKKGIDFFRLFSGVNYQRTYKKIDSHLRKAVSDNRNVQLNLQAAERWLAEVDQPKKSGFDRLLVEALQRLVALKRLQTSDICDRESYKILEENDASTKGKAHRKLTTKDNVNTIEYIVYYYSKHHAQICMPKYPTIFRRIYSEMDETMKRRVDIALKNFREAFYVPYLSKATRNLDADAAIRMEIRMLYGDLIADSKSVQDMEEAELVYYNLEELASEDPDGGEFLDDRGKAKILVQDKIKEAVERYVVEPCRYYVDKLGPDVFTPAIYDAVMIDGNPSLEEKDGSNIEYYRSWAKFRTCEQYLYFEHNLNSMIADLKFVAQLEARKNQK